jgi:multidrug efflux pump subunit AcrA (membrane-fusion protein)
LYAIGGGSAALAVLLFGAYLLAGPGSDSKDFTWHTVTKGPLEQTVVERGALEATENKEIVCPVKANKGGTFATTIKNLYVEDGEKVKKGQKLIELDSASLSDQLDSQNIIKDNAKLAWDKAQNDLIIQLSQNDTDIEAAKTTLTLAELDLKKYIEGDYPASLEDLKNQLEQWKDRVGYSDRMVKKGYMTSTQADADHYALAKVIANLKVLELDKAKSMATKQSALDEAKRNLKRVKQKTTAAETTSRKTAANAKSVYNQELARAKDLEKEIAKCQIYAPQSGIVVYVVPEQARFGVGGQQSIVAQGESVREGQKLLRIPSLDEMQVNIRVHEALYASVHPGQPALIRVDSQPDAVLQGYVKTVATVESKQDFLSADVKLYQTIVAVDREASERKAGKETKEAVRTALKELKPGMSATVSILIDRLHEPGLLVPIQAISDSLEEGRNPVVFVKNEDGEPEEREIEVGLKNDTMAHVKWGLKEGDRVVMNPGKLLKKKKRAKSKNGNEERKGPEFGPGKKISPKEGLQPGAPTQDKRAPGKPGPVAGNWPKGGKGGRPPGGNFDPKKMMEFRNKMEQATTPEARKQLLNQYVPDPEFRKMIKARLAGEGKPVAD